MDLEPIFREKGHAFSLVDKMPYCTNGDCLGPDPVQSAIRDPGSLAAFGDRQEAVSGPLRLSLHLSTGDEEEGEAEGDEGAQGQIAK